MNAESCEWHARRVGETGARGKRTIGARQRESESEGRQTARVVRESQRERQSETERGRARDRARERERVKERSIDRLDRQTDGYIDR